MWTQAGHGMLWTSSWCGFHMSHALLQGCCPARLRAILRHMYAHRLDAISHGGLESRCDSHELTDCKKRFDWRSTTMASHAAWPCVPVRSTIAVDISLVI